LGYSQTLTKKKIRALVEKTNSGFSAFAVDYSAFTTRKDFSELSNNLVEALNLYLKMTACR
jgi:hypothetical protein